MRNLNSNNYAYSSPDHRQQLQHLPRQEQHYLMQQNGGYLGAPGYNPMSPQDQNVMPPGIADNHMVVSCIEKKNWSKTVSSSEVELLLWLWIISISFGINNRLTFFLTSIHCRNHIKQATICPGQPNHFSQHQVWVYLQTLCTCHNNSLLHRIHQMFHTTGDRWIETIRTQWSTSFHMGSQCMS